MKGIVARLLAGTIIVIGAGAAHAQTAPAAPTAAPTVADDTSRDIIVTARQRTESLKDVPVAVTAVSGDTISEQQLVTVKDVAAFAPGLNINADGVGRASISIRGVGTTLIDSVQPGVGIFIDGVYQPNTTYLNSPLVDVERIEVLRGPQGTLFGNNTLGGAISIITKQPTNEWHGRVDGALATGDNYGSASASLSGPIISDILQFRIGAAYHTQDGFQRNTLAGGNQNPLETKSVNGSLRFHPASWATFTINGNYDRVFGGNLGYFNVTGPRDYTLNGQTNQRNLAHIEYYGGNIKGEFDVVPLKTKITAIGAYNESPASATGDGDEGPFDVLRAYTYRNLKTTTGEIRFDTSWSDHFSTLIGGFVSHYTSNGGQEAIIPSLGFIHIPATAQSTNNNQAIFGTAFLKLDGGWDIAAGFRYDHQKLTATANGIPFQPYDVSKFQPRVTLTKHWSPDVMTYVSVAKGIRGGGANPPGSPLVLYKGDSVWTYELGTKLTAFDRRLSLNLSAFYNDYRDFIGPNALAPSTGGGYVAINLNAGRAKSYGLEAEGNLSLTRTWRLYGNLTLLHERVTDSTEFQQTTGYAYPGDRIAFVPSINYMIGTNIRLPIVDEQSLVLDANVAGKGSRTGLTLDASSIPVLAPYALVNASLAWQHKGFEVAVFATNLNDAKYIESYLDVSELSRAGLPPPIGANLAIQGSRRRVGLRGSWRF